MRRLSCLVQAIRACNYGKGGEFWGNKKHQALLKLLNSSGLLDYEKMVTPLGPRFRVTRVGLKELCVFKDTPSFKKNNQRKLRFYKSGNHQKLVVTTPKGLVWDEQTSSGVVLARVSL